MDLFPSTVILQIAGESRAEEVAKIVEQLCFIRGSVELQQGWTRLREGIGGRIGDCVPGGHGAVGKSDSAHASEDYPAVGTRHGRVPRIMSR